MSKIVDIYEDPTATAEPAKGKAESAACKRPKGDLVNIFPTEEERAASTSAAAKKPKAKRKSSNPKKRCQAEGCNGFSATGQEGFCAPCYQKVIKARMAQIEAAERAKAAAKPKRKAVKKKSFTLNRRGNNRYGKPLCNTPGCHRLGWRKYDGFCKRCATHCKSEEVEAAKESAKLKSAAKTQTQKPMTIGFSVAKVTAAIMATMADVAVPKITIDLKDADKRGQQLSTLRDFCLAVKSIRKNSSGLHYWLLGRALQLLRPLPKTGKKNIKLWIPKGEWAEFLKAIGVGQDSSENYRKVAIHYTRQQAESMSYDAMLKKLSDDAKPKGGTGEGDDSDDGDAPESYSDTEVGRTRRSIGQAFKKINNATGKVTGRSLAQVDPKEHLNEREALRIEIDGLESRLTGLKRELSDEHEGDKIVRLRATLGDAYANMNDMVAHLKNDELADADPQQRENARNEIKNVKSILSELLKQMMDTPIPNDDDDDDDSDNGVKITKLRDDLTAWRDKLSIYVKTLTDSAYLKKDPENVKTLLAGLGEIIEGIRTLLTGLEFAICDAYKIAQDWKDEAGEHAVTPKVTA